MNQETTAPEKINIRTLGKRQNTVLGNLLSVRVVIAFFGFFFQSKCIHLKGVFFFLRFQWIKPSQRENNVIRKRPISRNGGRVTSMGGLFRVRSADILKLDNDCFKVIFDYLLLKDLIALGQTCQRLNRYVAEYIFQRSDSMANVRWEYGQGVCIGNEVKVKQFNPFIQQIRLWGDDSMQQWLTIQPNFAQLRRIEFARVNVCQSNLEKFKDILNGVEFVGITDCKLNRNFHEMIRILCPNVKRLRLSQLCHSENSIANATPNDCLKGKYSTLEYLELDTIESNCIDDGLTSFLELNPTIRNLSIRTNLLHTNAPSLIDSSVKLDNLAIVNTYFSFDSAFHQLLRELHRRNVYKRLKLYFVFEESLNQNDIDQLAALNAVVKLSISFTCFMEPLKLSNLNTLEGLMCIGRKNEVNKIIDWSDLPKNLTKLERITFWFASTDDILSFIRHAKKLTTIKIETLQSGHHFNRENAVIDVAALNKERKQLNDAEKVTIFVEETIYLATKWALNGCNFSHIKINRWEPSEWDHDFGLYRI